MQETRVGSGRCPHCENRPTWEYLEPQGATWIAHCEPCGWIGVGRIISGPAERSPSSIRIVHEEGGPGGGFVPSPWSGIYRVADRVRPGLVKWEPADAPCRGCGLRTVVRGIRENPKQRYVFELCLECGEVLVLRSLVVTPAAVRVDAGNVSASAASSGVRWLVRGVGLS